MKSHHFENGLVKIIDGREAALTVSERIVCNKLRKRDCIQDVPEADNTDFATGVLANPKKVDMRNDQFVDCRFLAPTSIFLERFFSEAGYALTKYRENLSPLHFKEQLFLYAIS